MRRRGIVPNMPRAASQSLRAKDVSNAGLELLGANA